MHTDQRTSDRRHDTGSLGERALMCEGCGRVSYSVVAGLVAERFACVLCGGRLRPERRTAERRAAPLLR